MYNKVFNVLLVTGFIMIFIGMTLTLDMVIKDNETKENIINDQAKKITELRKKCR